MGTKYSHDPSAYERGLEYQDFIMTELVKRGISIHVFGSRKYQYEYGESLEGIEIKFDSRCTETGRLSIEVEEKTALNKKWVKSGIYASPYTKVYLQGNYQMAFAFKIDVLRQLHKAGLQTGETPTIRKFYVPLTLALKKSAVLRFEVKA